MKNIKTTAPQKTNLTVLPSARSEEHEKQRPLLKPPNFDDLVDAVVTDHILSLLSKDDLKDVSEDNYESSVIHPAREGEQAVRQELLDTAESYAELKGYDPDLPALTDQPTEKNMKKFLTHEEN
jgi:hypothetical protein